MASRHADPIATVKVGLAAGSKLRPPTTTVAPLTAFALTRPSIRPCASPTRSAPLTPAASGVNDHPSPTNQSGRSTRYQSASLGRVPAIRSGYGSAYRYADGG